MPVHVITVEDTRCACDLLKNEKGSLKRRGSNQSFSRGQGLRPAKSNSLHVKKNLSYPRHFKNCFMRQMQRPEIEMRLAGNPMDYFIVMLPEQ